MSRITKTERACRIRKQRRVWWRKCKQCIFTMIWVAQVLFGILILDTSGQPLLNPALLGTVARVLPARRRRNSRQPHHAAASYSRFSSSLQDDTSIETQQERCKEQSVADGLPINERFEYADRAVSGASSPRRLDKLLADAEAERFSRLYFFSLSRLARESVIGLALIKCLVYVYKIRVISITEGVDSNREGWETLAQILFMQHERYLKELTAIPSAVRRETSPTAIATATTPSGTRPSRCLAPIPRAAGGIASPGCVTSSTQLRPNGCRIFHWFVVERRSLRWITRELNRLKAPKDHRATTDGWHHQMVARLIGNIKLIGLWRWGRLQNTRDPETGLVSQEERPVEESQQWLRTFPELQMIDPIQFLQAQQILAKNAEQYGKGRNKEGEFTAQQGEASVINPLHLLAGLVVCAECGRRLHVGWSSREIPVLSWLRCWYLQLPHDAVTRFG